MAGQLEELFQSTIDEGIEQNVRDSKWLEFLAKFHFVVDVHMSKIAASISELTAQWNTNQAWSLWNTAIEDAFLEFSKTPRQAEKYHRGRGKPNLVPTNTFKVGPCQAFNNNSFIKPVHKELNRICSQINWWRWRLARHHAKQKGPPDYPGRFVCHASGYGRCRWHGRTSPPLQTRRLGLYVLMGSTAHLRHSKPSR